MKKPKILFITGYFPFRQGGAEYQALMLARRIREDMDVFFVFRNHDNRPKCLKDQGFTLYAITPFKLKRINESFILEIKQLYGHLKAINPDYIYIRGANAFAMAANWYARTHKCRIIWHAAHDRDLLPFDKTQGKFRPLAYINKKIVEHGLKGAGTIVVQTRHQAALLRRNYNLPCQLVVGNWHPIPAPPQAKATDPVHVLWIANWRPFKQPQIFVRLALALKHVNGVNFTMIGRHQEYPKLSEKAIAAGIHLAGEIPGDQVNQALARSHLLVNTSELEGFSNTFIQAWMHCVPVISLKVDPDHVLTQKTIGRCSKSFNQLVSDTLELIINTDMREKMGHAARVHAVKNHSLNNIEQMAALLHLSEGSGVKPT